MHKILYALVLYSYFMAIKGVKGEFGGQCPFLPSKCEDSSEKIRAKTESCSSCNNE